MNLYLLARISSRQRSPQAGSSSKSESSLSPSKSSTPICFRGAPPAPLAPTDISTVNPTVASLSGAWSLPVKLFSLDSTVAGSAAGVSGSGGVGASNGVSTTGTGWKLGRCHALTLLGRQARRFLRHFGLNIPTNRVPKLTTFAL